jgi:uncharacterized membrane protein SpoIIM required for sporulation
MIRTAPVMLMPSLYQVKKNSAKGLLIIPLLLVAFFAIWVGVISASVIAGDNIAEQSLNTVQMLEQQYETISRTLNIVLQTNNLSDATLWQGVFIIGLVIAVGCFIGFWAGLYDSVSSRHYYVIDIRRKR